MEKDGKVLMSFRAVWAMEHGFLHGFVLAQCIFGLMNFTFKRNRRYIYIYILISAKLITYSY